MRFTLRAFVSMVALAGSAFSVPSQPSKRQEIINAGTIAAPADGTVIDPSSTFDFDFESYNYCYSGYEPVSVYLLAEPPSTANFVVNGESGGFANGTYLYQFGDYTVANYGLPPMNPPVPSTLVMPEASSFAVAGNYAGATLYIAAVETYTSCPVYFPDQYGITSNTIVYGSP